MARKRIRRHSKANVLKFRKLRKYIYGHIPGLAQVKKQIENKVRKQIENEVRSERLSNYFEALRFFQNPPMSPEPPDLALQTDPDTSH